MDVSHWKNLTAGYRTPFDPRPTLARLEGGDESAWDELWQELHHQGDVGVASYAAVPELVRIHAKRDIAEWKTYAIIGTIESCRGQGENPRLPKWLKAEYEEAWQRVISLACRDLPRASDETTVRSIIGAVAIAKGVRPLGDFILNFTGEELMEMMLDFQRNS